MPRPADWAARARLGLQIYTFFFVCATSFDERAARPGEQGDTVERRWDRLPRHQKAPRREHPPSMPPDKHVHLLRRWERPLRRHQLPGPYHHQIISHVAHLCALGRPRGARRPGGRGSCSAEGGRRATRLSARGSPNDPGRGWRFGAAHCRGGRLCGAISGQDSLPMRKGEDRGRRRESRSGSALHGVLRPLRRPPTGRYRLGRQRIRPSAADQVRQLLELSLVMGKNRATVLAIRWQH